MSAEQTVVLHAQDDLSTDTSAQRFDGSRHGGVDVSFFLNHTEPGRATGAHRHPYAEVFAIHDGEVTLTVDGEEIVGRAGDVVVVPPGATHGFVNTGETTLEMISIHPVAEMVTDWD